MRTRRWLSGLVIGLIVLTGGMFALPFGSTAQQDSTPAAEEADDDENQGAPVVGTPLLEPAIGLIEAQELALTDQADAAVLAVELEGDDGALVYEVTLDNGTEVEIDATSGAVLETEQSDDDDDDDDEEEGDDGDED